MEKEANTLEYKDWRSQITVNVTEEAQSKLSELKINADKEIESALQQHYNSYVKDGLQ